MIPLLTTIIFCTVLVVSCMSGLHKDLTDIKESVDNLLAGYYIMNFDFEEENESE